MPYLRPIAELVVDYLEAEGFDVVDWTALEVADNADVGCIPGDRVLDGGPGSRPRRRRRARHLGLRADAVARPGADAEDELGLPVLSAATAGAFTLLDGLACPSTSPARVACSPATGPSRDHHPLRGTQMDHLVNGVDHAAFPTFDPAAHRRASTATC